MENPEIKAFATIYDALEPLTEDARHRVIQWALNKYVTDPTQIKVATPRIQEEIVPPVGLPDTNSTSGDEPANFDSFAELLEAAGVESDVDLLVTAGYWLQRKQGESQFTGRMANAVLKPTGKGIDRMDNATRKILTEKPKRIIRKGQNSSTKGRGHLQLMLTDHGAAWVEGRISG